LKLRDLTERLQIQVNTAANKPLGSKKRTLITSDQAPATVNNTELGSYR
jgi:hypothetical protein